MALEAVLSVFARWLSPSEEHCSTGRRAVRRCSSFDGSSQIPGAFFEDKHYESRREDQTLSLTGSRDAGGAVTDARLKYNRRIADARPVEYPQLRTDQLYLDHAGTTIPSRSLVDAFSKSALTTLLGNPHSGSAGGSSLTASRMIDDVRLKVLHWFGADPKEFDVVFVANATDGIKLVAEGIRCWVAAEPAKCSAGAGECSSSCVHNAGKAQRCWLGYHADSHTSLVGLREEFDASTCFANDREVREWLEDVTDSQDQEQGKLKLFAYPAQSNMTGRKLPLDWLPQARARRVLTLLDIAALAPTSVLSLADVESSPDFTVLSFYKMFGMPDLGALLVKKSAGQYLRKKRYFGGGTVETVTVVGESWHIRKNNSLHEILEDGTLPIHNLSMLHAAFQAHTKLFGLQSSVEAHTRWLADHLYEGLSRLKHWNGIHLCTIYGDRVTDNYGPTLAFNLKDSKGVWVSNFEFEKLASVRNIQVRTGAVCNPGGTATALGLNAWEMQSNFSAGARCGGEQDIMNGKPTGVIRVSLGAMSIFDDVERFIAFVREFFVKDRQPEPTGAPSKSRSIMTGFKVERLTVYPIKSCAGWTIPSDTAWAVRSEGLAWDREWCLVHQGTGTALSQKAFPRMALLHPELDLAAGTLTVRYAGPAASALTHPTSIRIPLSKDPSNFIDSDMTHCSSSVCGDKIGMLLYASSDVNSFFSNVLDTPCMLARYPPASASHPSTRHAKPHLQQAGPGGAARSSVPLLLSNESPILVLSRSSLESLNQAMASKGADSRISPAAAFRANILLAEDGGDGEPAERRPFIEDQFESITILSGPACHSSSSSRPSSRLNGNVINGTAETEQDEEPGAVERRPTRLKMLGRCRRCQMVCIDPSTGERSREGEPFATLAKTRRSEGKVWFGVHAALDGELGGGGGGGLIRVGDRVEAEMKVG